GCPARDALWRSAGYAAVAAAVSLVVLAIWRDHGMITHEDLSGHVSAIAATLMTYGAHVLWPVDLAPIYPGYPSAERGAHPAAVPARHRARRGRWRAVGRHHPALARRARSRNRRSRGVPGTDRRGRRECVPGLRQRPRAARPARLAALRRRADFGGAKCARPARLRSRQDLPCAGPRSDTPRS